MPERWGTLPDFMLPDGRGGEGGTEEHLQRRDVVLAMLHRGRCVECDGARAALVGARERFESRGAAVLVLALSDEGRGPARAGELDDADGHVGKRLCAAVAIPEEPALLVCDRFGVVYAVLGIHALGAATAVDQAPGFLDFIDEQCPECGVPTW